MNASLLNSLVELCSLKGIQDAVLCPGSRSAPITLSFLKNKKFRCRTFSDERSAAFIALGIAQQTKKPVILVCTSGSAGYNFAPAVAEAFFQQIPLVILTADRPKEWIDQMDGQTIRQTDLYGRHVKRSYELPIEDPHPDANWHANRILNEGINLAIEGPPGPVHFNVPLREPLYAIAEQLELPSPRVIQSFTSDIKLSSEQVSTLCQEISGYKKILIVVGQQGLDPALIKTLNILCQKNHWPVVGDILSNLHSLPLFCSHTDTFLGQLSTHEKESLRPDLLITFGKSLISKNLKAFLRNYRPVNHWHIQSQGESPDTFQALTRILRSESSEFLQQLITMDLPGTTSWESYQKQWHSLEVKAQKAIKSFFDEIHEGEFKLTKEILSHLPSPCNLHLANSMTIRYANHLGIDSSRHDVEVFCNRGTSGIDGCTSTAVGSALASKIPNILITGDQAFFYDRNAFWHNYKIENLFVIILNNHGGIIFNLIDGPSGFPESEEYFITHQTLSAKSLASEFGFAYYDGQSNLKEFFSKGSTIKILELDSSQKTNKKIFEAFKNHIQKTYGT